MAVKLWLRLFPVRSYYFWRISPLITPWKLITRRFMTIEIIRSPRGAIYLVSGGGNLWISEFSVTVQGESYLSTSVQEYLQGDLQIQIPISDYAFKTMFTRFQITGDGSLERNSILCTRPNEKKNPADEYCMTQTSTTSSSLPPKNAEL